MSKVKYSTEVMLRSSPAILYNFLTSPSSLAQWFCDNCDMNGDIYTFEWDGFEEEAILEESDEDRYVRYHWVDSDKDEFFSFEISKSEISNDTVLTITDFAEEDEIDDQILLWESQIDTLSKRIGA